MKQLYYRVERCLGCKACEFACALAHCTSGDLFKLIKEQTVALSRKRVLAAKGKNYPLSCRHCRDAACVDACMARALVYDTQKCMVIHDESRCVGCWMCVMVCPYAAIRPNTKLKLPVRCDKCKDKDEPGCFNACPTHAILWQEETAVNI